MKIPKFPGMVAHLSSAQIAEFIGAMQAAGLDPTNVAAVIEFETGGSWSPSQHGPKAFSDSPGYAVGLIQFAPKTAQQLGTSSSALEAMSFEQQLPYIVRYFKRNGPAKLRRPVDYYASVFWPAAIGTDDGYVIAKEGSKVYDANNGLDRDKNGEITTADLARVMTDILSRASAKGYLEITPVMPSKGRAIIMGVGLVIIVTGFAFFLAKRRP
jgi:hypothetical protein